jgi:hypothetical protein
MDWLAANAIGFLIGSLLGATDNGLVDGIAGDVLFGACFGVAQVLVLSRYFLLSRWQMGFWVLACALGFLFGARLGARFSFAFASERVAIGTVFGLIMGTCVGLSQAAVMRFSWKFPHAYLWIPVNIVAWVLGESLAFRVSFSHAFVPLVAILIGAVQGMILVRLFPAQFVQPDLRHD